MKLRLGNSSWPRRKGSKPKQTEALRSLVDQRLGSRGCVEKEDKRAIDKANALMGIEYNQKTQQIKDDDPDFDGASTDF